MEVYHDKDGKIYTYNKDGSVRWLFEVLIHEGDNVAKIVNDLLQSCLTELEKDNAELVERTELMMELMTSLMKLKAGSKEYKQLFKKELALLNKHTTKSNCTEYVENGYCYKGSDLQCSDCSENPKWEHTTKPSEGE
jgi:hypothetical protein